ncbi:GrpB family protein [Macrococcus sp. DPC7161]|uniref:GrpB family protein n=1 Tax=Macrococcus sp. DPC7161 TaxID=2507060 RepID=UPI00100A596D|nr:GrpB family protein [Macrococcus sp. DPC7161]RXK18328.1 GrpB family protein [Macrococcus sp. DPC7161]
MAELRKVEVVPYDEKWIDQFNSEKDIILSIIGNEVLKVEHIGSTSIPGLSAKPTIDVLVVVRDIECIDHFNSLFESKGYSVHGENGIIGRRYFSKKDGTKHLVHVHIYDVTNEYEINRHIAFRDYLIHHPNKAKAYGDLKEDLAVKYPFNIEGYIDGKHELVQRFTDEAMFWFDGKS